MIHPTNNKTLSQKVTWHLKVFGGAVLISVFFSLVLMQKFVHAQSLTMILITFVQLEIFVWLGTWFFQTVKTGPGFKKKTIFKLVQFYLLVLVIAALFYFGLYTYMFFMQGGDWEYFLPNLLPIFHQ